MTRHQAQHCSAAQALYSWLLLRRSCGTPVKADQYHPVHLRHAPSRTAVSAARCSGVAPDPLTRMKLIKEIDRGSLAAFGEAWHAGDARTSLVDAASEELRQWAREFGLTPSAEGAVRPPELPDGDDPFV
jgi:phage terminase small subunit